VHLVDFWPFWALIFSFLGAGVIGFNHRFQVDGRALVVGRVLGVLPFALASGLWLPWPHDPWFYAAAAGMGVLLTLADVLLFNAAATHGGRLTALYVPLKMYLAFFFWGIFAGAWPDNTLHWLVVMVCFGVSAWALTHIRRTDASWRAVQAVAPVALLFALGDVVAKAVVPAPTGDGGLAAIAGAVTAYLLVTNVVSALLGLARGKVVLDGRALGVATAFGAYLYLSITVLLVTIALAPNPGYVGAITLLSTVWLALWAYLRGREKSNLWACLALAGSAMILAFVMA